MLVLSRKSGEGLSFTLEDNTVVRLFVEPCGRGKVKCVIDAPPEVRIDRPRTGSNLGWITKSTTR